MESKVMFVFPLNSCLGSYLVLPILLLDLISCIFRYSRQPTCSLAIFSLEFYFSLHRFAALVLQDYDSISRGERSRVS